MSKKVELIGIKFHEGSYEENVTEVNGRLITKINTTEIESKRKITMIDKTGLKLIEIYVPEVVMVKITR